MNDTNQFAAPGATTTTVDVTALKAETAPAPAPATPPAYNPVPALYRVPAGVPAAPARPVMQNDDDIDFREITLPTLNVVQGVGELCKSFDPGQLILGQKYMLCSAPNKREGQAALSQPPVKAIVLGFRPTRYTEKVSSKPGEPPAQGRTLDSEQQVFAIGGTTLYKEAYVEGTQVRPYFQSLATALVLVQAPEAEEYALTGDELDAAFPLVDDAGKHWQLVQWHMKGTAFTHGAKTLKTARRLGWLRKGYSSKLVTIQTQLAPAGKNWVFAPVIRNAGDTTPEEQAFGALVLRELLGSAAPASMAPEPSKAVPMADAAPAAEATAEE